MRKRGMERMVDVAKREREERGARRGKSGKEREGSIL